MLKGPVVIDAQGVYKAFRIPDHRFDSLRERATHPFQRVEYREHQALEDVSFDVRQGEFFGIVGRNGSGKSTLLKILASIYRADAGRVRTAGLIAPFIELGVGLNLELTARDNAVLNGVLMGQSLRRARRSLDAVLDFAELEDFADLQLKNYSSGMLVRFAFAVMVQADADVMLIDEVLAVGDAAFSDKCLEVFRERRRAGKTIVLVTHDMTTVQTLCHRAMLLEDGRVRHLGDPEDAALQYYKLNFATMDASLPDAAGKVVDVNARVVGAVLNDADGEPTAVVESEEPLRLDVVLSAARRLEGAGFTFHFRGEDGQTIFSFERILEGRLDAGEQVAFAGEVENPLVPGRYILDVYIGEFAADGGIVVQGLRLLEFTVDGPAGLDGVVRAQAQVEPVALRPA